MMMNTLNKKLFIFIAIFTLLLCSMSITFIYENNLSDGLSITVSVIAGISLFFTAVITIFEMILDICNP
ncbi:hypothetical protein A6M14_11125 [Acinetobacter sp. Ac_877]|uniref:hypothetical protein n=1 Tax=Acinetobacter portensis TaxID=1839785 RepID=UPI00128C65DA|nr:hypothetical protein [Acinetobacter portensis]MPW42138.1 hypothetical protein [Acinetobacter portensis]